ncbi:expansin family protein [Pseudohyphozyma bogoriensis]|nr:expansin family protein [Pseudohyphozyma bogoriensis]
MMTTSSLSLAATLFALASLSATSVSAAANGHQAVRRARGFGKVHELDKRGSALYLSLGSGSTANTTSTSSSSTKKAAEKSLAASSSSLGDSPVYNVTALWYTNNGSESACHTYNTDDELIFAVPSNWWDPSTGIADPNLCGKSVLLTNPSKGYSITAKLLDNIGKPNWAGLSVEAAKHLGMNFDDGELPITYQILNVSKSITPSVANSSHYTSHPQQYEDAVALNASRAASNKTTHAAAKVAEKEVSKTLLPSTTTEASTLARSSATTSAKASSSSSSTTVVESSSEARVASTSTSTEVSKTKSTTTEAPTSTTTTEAETTSSKVATVTGSAKIVRTGGSYDNTAVADGVDQDAATPAAGNYKITNVALGECITFTDNGITFGDCDSDAAVISLAYTSTIASSWPVINTDAGVTNSDLAADKKTFLLQGSTGSCSAAQFIHPADGGDGYNDVMTSYNCYDKASSPLVKFIWYLVPSSDSSALSKRSSETYFLLSAQNIGTMVTSALTGANKAAFDDHLGIALTDLDVTDEWELFTIESA